MAVDEATQTNGVPEPTAGQLKQDPVAAESKWTVESGMS
jgi:putative hydrolase of HD superfamily